MDVKKYPNDCLLEVASEITEIDEEVKSLAAAMFEAMYESRGIGLAAPQVGVSRRLIVLNVAANPEEGTEFALVNPEVTECDEEMVVADEGCLSLPGVTAPVPRWRRLKVRALDLDGREIVVEGDGLLSRALQHEMDHLEGILFITKVSPVDKVAIKPKLRELKEKAR
ncbi:MAG: peptide deformylase [Planctomycetota bacterium]|jgi:peptide deformylase